MTTMLSEGQTVKGLITNTAWTVRELLGSGGQGEVYRVTNDGHDDLALKWYLPEQATQQQHSILRSLVERGEPSERFLWPIDVTVATSSQSFGYVMPLRKPQYKGLVDLMLRRVEPSFRSLCTTCFELAHHYMKLHTSGLAYRDISFGNVFFDPQSGEVLICDNDNVCIEGSEQGGVIGTPRFMAPEIVRGEEQPSTKSDLFSLSVLLFFILFLHHPLEGERERKIHSFDLPAMRKLYGDNPVFIFSPSDTSNRPVRGYHDNALIYWSIYPQFIRDLFTRAFTDGLEPDTNKRIKEGEWRQSMVRLRDSIVFGPKGHENFYDNRKAAKGEEHICWATNKPIQLPPRIKIDSLEVCLTLQTVLSPYHLTSKGRTEFDFDTTLARVIKHPNDPTVVGIKNETHQTWTVTTKSGELQIVPPGKSVTIKAGIEINFGETKGQIIV